MDLLEEVLAGPPTMSRHQMRTVFEGEEDTCDTILKQKLFDTFSSRFKLV